MGLAYDSNKALPIVPPVILNTSPYIHKKLSLHHHAFFCPQKSGDTDKLEKEPTSVVAELVEEANVPRNGTMRIPKEKVKWIEYLLDKYGEDYEVFTTMKIWIKSSSKLALDL